MLLHVLIVFFAGFFVGKFINTQWIGKYRIVTLFTVFLLFTLGLEIGANDELFKKMDEILLYGFLIALFGSLGSFMFGYTFERLNAKSLFKLRVKGVPIKIHKPNQGDER
ncbi:MAG: LysO family transporter [Pseudothermotoga sp.]